jgi:hypothetical protein
MARKAQRQAQKLAGWLAAIIGFIVSLAIGGYFVAGGFMNVVILSLLPLVVHQVVGWAIILTAIISAVLSLVR